MVILKRECVDLSNRLGLDLALGLAASLLSGSALTGASLALAPRLVRRRRVSALGLRSLPTRRR